MSCIMHYDSPNFWVAKYTIGIFIYCTTELQGQAICKQNSHISAQIRLWLRVSLVYPSGQNRYEERLNVNFNWKVSKI